MTIKLEHLPDELLVDVFQLINPVELFQYCFLNKHFYQTIYKVIDFNLKLSIYNDDKYKAYSNLQQEYIKCNGNLMKHINISSDNIDYLNYCPNIESIFYYVCYDENINNKLEIDLLKLKRLSIYSLNRDYNKIFKPISKYLNQIEQFELQTVNGDITSFINYLNPEKLESFKLNFSYDIYVDGLDIIKREFNKLKLLHLKSKGSIITSIEFDSKLNFNSNLKLIIEGYFDNDFNINCFGNLSKLNNIKLNDLSSSLFKLNNESNMNILLKQGNTIIKLGSFSFLEDSDNIKMLRLTNLREISMKRLSSLLLDEISRLSNIQILTFDSLFLNIDSIISNCILCLKNNEPFPIQCSFIKQINVNAISFTPLQFFCFLSLFPNLEKIHIKQFNLLENSNINIDCEFTDPLLLILPYNVPLSKEFYDLIINMPMLNWIKVEQGNE
ncbi:hypothetical protein K502DRAFT_366493 [Neoconidiobolus thromboides FSU 785]|nr:hypothetical protein K502DRAFT_366493 [Neoconidiobolus thromboides FSU 785]